MCWPLLFVGGPQAGGVARGSAPSSHPLLTVLQGCKATLTGCSLSLAAVRGPVQGTFSGVHVCRGGKFTAHDTQIKGMPHGVEAEPESDVELVSMHAGVH